MALTLTQLAAALRIGDGQTAPPDPIASILTRQLGVAQAFVELIADGAPDAIKDEATVRMAGYLYDSPTAGSDMKYSDAWRNSGAASLIARWVVRRLGDATGTPSTSNAGGLTEEDRARLLPENATDGQIAVYQTASGLWAAIDLTGGGTVDLVARDAAIAAQADADAAGRHGSIGGGGGCYRPEHGGCSNDPQ